MPLIRAESMMDLRDDTAYGGCSRFCMMQCGGCCCIGLGVIMVAIGSLMPVMVGALIDGNAARDGAHAAKRARLSEESSRSLPSSFFCAISHSVMRDPVVCADGMTYERAYIESWLLAHDTSPLTNQPLAHKLLVPNIALKQAIAEMLDRV